MNYQTLFNTIKTYVENDFPVTAFSGTDDVSTVVTPSSAQVNTFIQQAEQRIYNSVQIPSLRRNVTGNVTANNGYLSCPDDFLSVYSIAVVDTTGRYLYLLNKDVNFIREAYPYPMSVGLPKYYALFGSTLGNLDELSFILGPTPDQDYTVELHYFYYPESIVTAGASWLGENFDSVLLYGSMVEAYTYMKGEQDIITFYDNKYKEALSLLKRLGDGLERQDAYRSGQVRVKVT